MPDASTLRRKAEAESDAEPPKKESPLSPLGLGGQIARREFPRYGDFVILYGSHALVLPVVLERGRVSNSRLGNYRHDDIVSTAYGSKVQDRKSKRWLVVLHPSPDLFSLALTHRTQILYHSDISLVLMLLDACPGKRICEAGTGSGSLSCHLARAVAPVGHVFTYEFHRQRKLDAEADFKRLGLASHLSSFHRDVCAEGFVRVPAVGSEGEYADLAATSASPAAAGAASAEGSDARAASGASCDGDPREQAVPAAGSIDGLFLDVPSPWLALDHVDTALREGGRFVNFSPCIEQVQRVCECLHERGYHGIQTFEVFRKPWGVWTTKPAARSLAPREGESPAEPGLARDAKRPKRGDTEPPAAEAPNQPPPPSGGEGKVKETQKPAAATASRKANRNKPRSADDGDGCQGLGSAKDVSLATFPLLISQLLGQSVPEEFWTPAMQLEGSKSEEGDCEQGAGASKSPRDGGCASRTDGSSSAKEGFIGIDRTQTEAKRRIVPIDFEATHYPLPLRGHTGYLTVAVKQRTRALSGKLSEPC
ncbi:putative tRNA(adenine-N(1)-)-methyltransferase catalytic subunit [Neospora caninum Liverpool]|nr:putative tRNA(adenine-N(1)-)-methyltransferase catalytic subunit [Neospora caninum Liverpool]CBZ51420.1 putative tRNA(adenine-N(1)-)-methyltransferase catalytic subunit [Neospora caninum Liverpool]|eukprot:XP_003881453.1 putative tRNA(adenine-N(1)-)-methyltransferase catalytic subunit [Neospora caninum Liverpool]